MSASTARATAGASIGAGERARGAAARAIRGRWAPIGATVLVLAVQVALAAVSIAVLSSVRAYVGGESLYSKGQKEAQMALRDYIANKREEDFERFRSALEVPSGDRRARLALQQPRPDREAAREGFLAGGNDPEDVTGLIWLFEHFATSRLMQPSVRLWAAGDEGIEELRRLGDTAYALVHAGAEPERLADLRRQAIAIDRRLTPLEQQFSAQLADASRKASRWLLALNIAAGAMLGAASVAFQRQRLQERAAAEHEIRRRQEQLQQLLDSTAEGIVGVDLGGHCTFSNRCAQAILACPHAGEIVGRDVRRWLADEYGPHDHPFDAAIVQGHPVHLAETRFRRLDGSTVPVSCWCHPVVRDGRPEGAVLTFFDISQQLRARKALGDSETRLSRLVDAVGDAVVSVDSSGRVVLFNRAAEAIFGVAAAQCLGQDVKTLIAPDSQARLSQMLAVPAQAASPAVQLKVYELRGRRPGGEEVPLEASTSHVDTDVGMVATIILRDASVQEQVRKEREARLALEASSRAKTGFLSRMSHELRTPLNAVLGFARLMAMDKGHVLSETDRVRLGHIEDAGNHLLALVNDVLDLSRVESGHVALSLEPVDAAAVAMEGLAVAAQLSGARGPAVRPIKLGQDRAPRVFADRVRLRQVLINLLSNAVKYSSREGQVELEIRASGDDVEFVVSDTGQGMSPDQLAHLFEPFNRLGAERSAVEGTGIGLVLSRHLVSLMKGRLDIESVLGRGTTAVVSMRRADNAPAEARTTAAGVASRVTAPSAGSLDVLYAEDNELNVELLRQIVSLAPDVVLRVAANGHDAIGMAHESPPRLMLVDMQLGDMTGLDVARALRGDLHTAGIRLVAVSADAMPEQVEEALRSGFDEYLTKPINVAQMLRVFVNCAREASAVTEA